MELRSYFNVLRRRYWIIILMAVLAASAAAALNELEAPSYTSAVTVRIATVGSGIAGERSDISLSDRVMNTYARIVTGASVRSQIVERLSLTERPGISAETIPGTELLRIQASASTGLAARDIADMAAQVLVEQSRESYSGSGRTTQEILLAQISQVESELSTAAQEYKDLVNSGNSTEEQLSAASQLIELKERTYATLLDQYERLRLNEVLQANSVSIVEPAYVPSSPAKPRKTLNLILGIMVGGFLGIALALLIDNLDTKLYTTGQIQSTVKLPTIGKIPTFHQKGAAIKVANNRNGDRMQFEAFRLLRINLLSRPEGQSDHQALLITSADVGEGKSTVAVNLAVTFARSGRKVVVVDCNMHNSVLHKVFELPNDIGLTTVLTDQASVAGVVQATKIPGVSAVTNGPAMPTLATLPVPSSMVPQGLAERLDQESELLGSAKMATVIEHLRRDFDVVLLDTPALLSVMDAAVLAPLADHVVLVVERLHARRDALSAASERLRYVHADSISVVINRSEEIKWLTPSRVRELA